MVRSKSVTFLCVTCSFAVAMGACVDAGPAYAESCGVIGVGGCPGNSQATCADLACDFVASCSAATGRWVPVVTCPARDAGSEAGFAGDGDADAASGRDASVVPTEAGAAGACPPLQLPDCSEELRAACGAGCCGCEDVFRCEGGGWVDLGPCVP